VAVKGFEGKKCVSLGYAYLRIKMFGHVWLQRCHVVRELLGDYQIILGRDYLAKTNIGLVFEPTPEPQAATVDARDPADEDWVFVRMKRTKRKRTHVSWTVMAVNVEEIAEEGSFPNVTDPDEFKKTWNSIDPRVKKILKKLNGLVATDITSATAADTAPFEIRTVPNPVPFKRTHQRMSPAEKLFVEQLIMKLLKAGLIRPTSSPWGAPIVLARKKDGSLRLCRLSPT
jgi:hypothetical protein